MRQLYRHLTFSFLLVALGAIAIQISCVEVGPVPQFEYSYDFDSTLPSIDTTTLSAPPVTMTPGTVSDEMTSFRDDLASPVQAASYASQVDATLNTTQKTYWTGQNQSGIASGLESGNATLTSQLAAATSAFLANGTLNNLVPALVNATGTSGRSSGRTASASGITEITDILDAQQQDDELADCQQAAQDAFDEAVVIIDALRNDQLAAISARYAGQFPLTAQRTTLESAANTRHANRIAIYLGLFNQITTNINSLFSANSITVAERDLLRVSNRIIYGLHYEGSITLLTSELTLIDNLITQSETSLTASRDNLINQVNTSYNTELNRLTQLRNSTQSFCHNQGGVNTN